MTDAVKTLSVVYQVDVDAAIGAQVRMIESTRQVSGELNRLSQTSQSVDRRLLELARPLRETSERFRALTGIATNAGNALLALSHHIGASRDGLVSRLGSLAAESASTSQALATLGSMLGPAGGIAGAIVGFAIPAIREFYDSLVPVVPAVDSTTRSLERASAATETLSDRLFSAGQRMRDFVDSLSSASRRRQLFDLNAQITELSDEIARISASGSALERLSLPELRERLSSMVRESAELSADIESAAPARRTGGRAVRSQQTQTGPTLEQLLQAATRPSETDPFGLNRLADEYAARAQAITREIEREREEAARAEQAALERQLEHLRILDEEDRRMMEDRRQRHLALAQEITSQIEGAATMWGGVISNAYMSAIQGQEDFGVAVAKGFKQIAIQFGGQMIAEGIGALFTAIGNTVLNPPVAATKAAEGAGKLALGLSLGAAGAAVSVPKSAPQSAPPRLGPDSKSDKGSSVVVNLNAPSVVTGSAAHVGRVISRTVVEATERYGRLS